MADTPEQEIVSAISAAGWLQGDTVSGDALIEHISEEVLKGQFEGVAPAYWMLASHSCTVHARNLCDAPWIEWIAVKVKKRPLISSCTPSIHVRCTCSTRKSRFWSSRFTSVCGPREPCFRRSTEIR